MGADQRLAIYISRHDKGTHTIFSSRYHRWYEEFRPNLFSTIQYIDITSLKYKDSLTKAESQLEAKIWQKIVGFSLLGRILAQNQTHLVYFHNAPRYWIRSMGFIPYFWNERDGEQISTQVKSVSLPIKLDASAVIGVLNSSLFYWWFILLSDCRHLNMREIERFPFGLDKMGISNKQELLRFTERLMKDLKDHSKRREVYYKTTGQVVYDEFYPKHSKPIIDEIDRVLAQHYGFTAEELEFIINYDIKYRMGTDYDAENE